jgi:hypothetical protein
MSGYLYFDETGCPEIDAILAALTHAGNMYHQTVDWTVDWTNVDGDGFSERDRIQMAAVEAAAEIERLKRPAKSTLVVQEILKERRRQIEQEGWTAQHDDDEHPFGELAKAAACYAYPDPQDVWAWPWDACWDKRDQHSRRRQLVIAGALTVAEIERLDREAKRRTAGG